MAFNYNGSPVGHSQPMAEINVIPLVDIMLVLLVVFIITAPLFHQAVSIDLPKVDATRMEDEPHAIQVALDEKGLLSMDGDSVDIAELAARLTAAAETNQTAPELHLRADRGTRYERVTEVMALAQGAGISRIAFVTDRAGVEEMKQPLP